MRMNVNIGTRGSKKGCTIFRASLDPTPKDETTVSVKNQRTVQSAMMDRRRNESARVRIAQTESKKGRAVISVLRDMVEKDAPKKRTPRVLTPKSV